MDRHRQTKTRRFRDLIARRMVVMPGAANALTAIQIERAGFDALYVSGAGLAAVRGLPDLGLLSMAEVASDAGTIARAVAIPALGDADTGYGGPLTVMRTVREFERAGLAGIHIEDQQDPKKCGHLSGKRLIPASEMARKIAAATEAREDHDFLIVARTDARAVEGLDGAIERARSYVQAGADAIFPEALESVEEFREFAERLSKQEGKVSLVANMTEFGKTPYLSAREFEELGYRIVLFPLTALRVATKAIEATLAELKTLGTQRESLGEMSTRQQLYDLLRYADYERQDRDLSERYGRDTENREK
jgi:methylisocitrate lyase